MTNIMNIMGIKYLSVVEADHICLWRHINAQFIIISSKRTRRDGSVWYWTPSPTSRIFTPDYESLVSAPLPSAVSLFYSRFFVA